MSDSEVRESVSRVGLRFTLSYKTQTDADLTTKLTIIGNETGGQASINVTVFQTNSRNHYKLGSRQWLNMDNMETLIM